MLSRGRMIWLLAPPRTVQTVDLILPRIGRIPQLHSCIEKKILPQWLCCIVRTFTLAP